MNAWIMVCGVLFQMGVFVLWHLSSEFSMSPTVQRQRSRCVLRPGFQLRSATYWVTVNERWIVNQIQEFWRVLSNNMGSLCKNWILWASKKKGIKGEKDAVVTVRS